MMHLLFVHGGREWTGRARVFTTVATGLTERGYTAGGVRGIEMRDPKTKTLKDRVVAMDVIQPTSQLLVVGSNGYGKRTDLASYRAQGRGGRGIKTMDVTSKTGPVIDAAVVEPEDVLMVLSENGVAIRMEIKGIRAAGRPLGRPIVHAGRQHAHRAGHQFLRVRAPRPVFPHVVHLAVQPGAEPAREMADVGAQTHAAHPDRVESPAASQRRQVLFELAEVFGRGRRRVHGTRPV